MQIPTVVVLQSLVALFALIPIVTSVNGITVGIQDTRTACDELRCPRYMVVKSYPEDRFEVRDLEASKWISTKVPLRTSLDMLPAMRIARQRLALFLNGQNTEKLIVNLGSPLVHHIHTECGSICQPVLTTSMFVPSHMVLPLPTTPLVFFTDMPRTEVAALAFHGPITDFNTDVSPRLSKILQIAQLKGLNLGITNSNVLLAEYVKRVDEDESYPHREIWVVPSRFQAPLSQLARSVFLGYNRNVLPSTARFADRLLSDRSPIEVEGSAKMGSQWSTYPLRRTYIPTKFQFERSIPDLSMMPTTSVIEENPMVIPAMRTVDYPEALDEGHIVVPTMRTPIYPVLQAIETKEPWNLYSRNIAVGGRVAQRQLRRYTGQLSALVDQPQFAPSFDALFSRDLAMGMPVM